MRRQGLEKRFWAATVASMQAVKPAAISASTDTPPCSSPGIRRKICFGLRVLSFEGKNTKRETRNSQRNFHSLS